MVYPRMEHVRTKNILFQKCCGSYLFQVDTFLACVLRHIRQCSAEHDFLKNVLRILELWATQTD